MNIFEIIGREVFWLNPENPVVPFVLFASIFLLAGLLVFMLTHGFSKVPWSRTCRQGRRSKVIRRAYVIPLLLAIMVVISGVSYKPSVGTVQYAKQAYDLVPLQNASEATTYAARESGSPDLRYMRKTNDKRGNIYYELRIVPEQQVDIQRSGSNGGAELHYYSQEFLYDPEKVNDRHIEYGPAHFEYIKLIIPDNPGMSQYVATTRS